MIYKGGDVLASGGFGCIFEPSLKCEDTVDNKNPKNLSKLMLKKNAQSEFKQISNFRNLLSTIPNYNNYFLLNNFTICKPSKLTNSDLSNFKKCKALTKRGYTKKNVNKSLDDLLVINMPNGGINVEEFVNRYFTKNNLIHLNNSLIDLLINGILPMNERRVFHCDIKDSNVLVDNTFRTRLIDWGLSVHYSVTNNNNTFPKTLYRRPFQYNAPFSNILFNKEFIKLYSDFLVKNSNPEYYSIREFVVNYIFVWNEIRGSGHLEAINSIIKEFSEDNLVSIDKKKVKDHMIEYNFTYYYIIEYISKILLEYTNNGVLNLKDYFNNVFIKNVDIWGFTTIYISIFEILYKSKNTELYKSITEHIKQIIQNFLFSNPTNVINTSLLVDELTKLNNLFQNIDETIIIEEVGGKKKHKKTRRLVKKLK